MFTFSLVDEDAVVGGRAVNVVAAAAVAVAVVDDDGGTTTDRDSCGGTDGVATTSLKRLA